MTKKNISIVSLIVALTVGIVVFPALADNNDQKTPAQINTRIKAALNNWRNDWNTNIELKNTVNNTTKVKANIRVKILRGFAYDVSLKAQATNLPSKPGMVFESWLVDNEGNYKLSLGALTPINKSRADFQFSQKMVNPTIYDTLVITAENMNDANPNPGEIIFSADLHSIGLPDISLRTTLSGRQEIPATDSKATGSGKFVINTNTNTITYHIIFRGLSSKEIGAHIHGPARAGANAAVLTSLPLGNEIKGEWKYDEAMESKILEGHMYVNIQSEKFPDGEIRGQIVF